MRSEIFTGIDQVDEEKWNSLTAGYPFSSTVWCKLSEAYQDFPHIYVLVYQDNQAVGCALFQIRYHETIPTSFKFVHHAVNWYLRKHPLVVCRSPFETSYNGLFLPTDPTQKQPILNKIREVAEELAKTYHASFILSDYLDEELLNFDWGKFIKLEDFAYQNNIMAIEWQTYEEYLQHIRSVSKKRLKNIRYNTRQAEELGTQVKFLKELNDLEGYLRLIQSNAEHYGLVFNEAENRKFLKTVQENLPALNKTWAMVYQQDELVASELLIFDHINHICKPIFYGRNHSSEHAYFYLAYQDIRYAIEELKAQKIDYGTHASEFKKRLGFKLANTNHLVFYPHSFMGKILVKILMPLMNN